jgi:hypothetical protein
MLPAQTNRIAQIKSYFLEDDAISLNGRKYPAESVNRLIQSAQAQLSDPNALPLTCYVSHDDAYMDATRHLVGGLVKVDREGTKAYALIDIPDTTAGRDVATLIRGRFIRTMSLRASNAEMFIDKNEQVPLVGGSRLQLDGIDFTTSPGLPQVARIADITESHTPQSINEVFHANIELIEESSISASPVKEQPMTPEEKAALLEELKAALVSQQNTTQETSVEEALRVLQRAGYTASPPKTQDELLQEKFDTMQAAFEQKLAQIQEALAPKKPQRRSLVEGSNTEGQPKKPYYRKGDYIREQLHDPKTLVSLLDRSQPLPEWLDPERALKELELSFMGLMDAQQSLDGSVFIDN